MSCKGVDPTDEVRLAIGIALAVMRKSPCQIQLERLVGQGIITMRAQVIPKGHVPHDLG